MTVAEIRKQIEKKEAEKEKLLLSFEQMRESIIAIIKPYLTQRIQELVQQEVKGKSEHTKSLGIDKLGEMKKALEDLLKNCDSVVEEVFANDKLWIHVDYKIDSKDGSRTENYYTAAKNAEKDIHSGIRRVLGKAGKLLADYGYIKATPSQPYASNQRGEWLIERSEYIYNYGFSFHNHKNISDSIKKYCDAIPPFHGVCEDLPRLAASLSSQEALDLWEQA